MKQWQRVENLVGGAHSTCDRIFCSHQVPLLCVPDDSCPFTIRGFHEVGEGPFTSLRVDIVLAND